MAVSHRGAISFGLVHIPVALYTATKEHDIQFNQLHKEDGSRIKYKKSCVHCGEEVVAADIIKGFEASPGKYVTVTEADFEKIKTEKDKSLNIIHFTDLQNIRPIFYEKTYYIVPEAGGEKAFTLLHKAMQQTNKVAIAKTVLGTKETLLAIIPHSDGLMVETLFFDDEIRDLPKEFNKPEVSEPELQMAAQLISSMDKPFEPEQFHDEYQERLRALIADKIAGNEITTPSEEFLDNVINLMDALKQSVEQSQRKTS